MKRFPEGFVWGAATSAYQIEGSPLVDGAGASIWHRFAHTPGTVRGGDTGDVACDHYRRWRSDVALMREMGLRAYRFSVAWPRVLPDGQGEVNEAGLAFYEQLVEALLEAGIEPYVTLYHWDLPAALQDRGGWANRESADWFARYARVVFERLGSKVKHWMTLNEPFCVAEPGYITGAMAPGQRDLWAGLRAAHHLLLAHGRAVRVFRELGLPGQIGVALNLTPHHAASESDEDRAAAERVNAWVNRMYLEPLARGTYPEVIQRRFAHAWPRVAAGDLSEISQPIDFLGINYYMRFVMQHAPGEGLMEARAVPQGRPETEMGWEIYPEGFAEVVDFVKGLAGDLPLYVTENGAAFDDCPAPEGAVDDQARERYLRDHLTVMQRLASSGTPLRGYFAWSLFDNFEWAHGYSKRFGLVRVDYATQERSVKRSGRFYARVVEQNGIPDA